MVTDAAGTVVGEDRFYPFGETRFTTGNMQTDKLFTGQRQITGLGIYHFGARFYSPKLGRFLSPDTIVPSYANPQNLNRFSYTLNNPLRYTDPTGHNVDCGIDDPYCAGRKPRVNDPDAKCNANAHCLASYKTYAELSKNLRRKPTSAELLSMTASAEYYPLVHRPDAGNLRGYAQEALARNYYSACGGEDNLCTDNQTYQFLSGYEPWWRQTGGATPASRAKDIVEKLNANPYKTELNEDVGQILDLPTARDRTWTGGQYWNKPWQWRNVTYKPSQTGDLNSNTGAIMYIDLGGGNGYFGQYFWVVTARQDWCYKYPDDPQWCK